MLKGENMSKGTFIGFILGAAIGSVATWYVSKKYYEKKNQEDIDSVKQVFTYKKPENDNVEYEKEVYEAPKTVTLDETKKIEKPDVMEYAARIKSEGYVDYSTSKPQVTNEKRPYVISPDEFGEFDDYSKISFMYYADHVLCDELDQIVDNADELIGIESLGTFGQYDDDSVYVRNDLRKTDYEILRSLRTYSEVIEENPYKAEV